LGSAVANLGVILGMDEIFAAADYRERSALELPHDEFCRTTEFVGHTRLSSIQYVAVAVLVAPIVLDQVQPSCPESQFGLPEPPRATGCVGDQDANIEPDALKDIATERLSAGIRIQWQEGMGSEPNIGSINACRGLGEPKVGAHDRHLCGASYHPFSFARQR